jgi:D-3-phosphoglycerate dehydrogenase
VAKEADILSVHLALNPDTEGIVNEEIFNAMKEGSYFINTSRGPVVDEASLLDAMKNKGIRAGLDVFCDEPGANDSNFVNPLKNEENFVGTHHIGASTAQAQDAVASEAVRVILDFKDNGVVPNSVNLCERSPATHMLVVRHLDKIGVLASVFELLKKASINVQETENIIFDGAKAAAARIQIDSEVDSETLKDIRMSDSILAANLIKF